MADMGRRQPAADEPLHSLPLDATILTPPFKSAMPEMAYREAAQGLQRAIQQMDGPDRAADIIEQVLKLRSTQAL